MHGIPIDGLSVDGRDVVVRGPIGSAITSPETRAVLASVKGVRGVHAVLSATTTMHNDRTLEPDSSAAQRELQDKIDRILENQDIAFNTESTVLTPESELALAKVARLLAEAPGLRCEIRAYDGQRGESRQTSAIALRRALVTEDYLVSRGIEEWRLSAHAFQTGEGERRKGRLVDLVVRAR